MYTTPDNPVLVVGILTLIAAICLFLLPDMRKHNHPNTLEDLNDYQKQRKLKRKKKGKEENDKRNDDLNGLIDPSIASKSEEESNIV